MKIPRVRIYLNFIDFIKSLFQSNFDSKSYLSDKLKNKLDKKHIFFSGMCRSAYILILDYLKHKFPDKDEIILCAYNLPEMVNITVLKNFKIKFVDIEINNGVMNPIVLEKKISDRTAAVLYTNMFNDSKNLLEVKDLCNKKNIILIEDTAIYLGNYTIRNGLKEYAGSYGDVSLLSFGIMKNYNSLFGGALLTSSDEIADFVSLRKKQFKKFIFKDYLNKIILFLILKLSLSKIIYNLIFFYIINFSEKYNIKFLKNIFYPALKFKIKKSMPNNYQNDIPNFCYKILCNYFKNEKKNNFNHELRKNNNKLYFDELSEIKEISLINITDINFQNFLDFPIIIHKNKKKLIRYLFDRGLEVRSHFYSNCQRYFLDDPKPNSDIYEDQIICLPSHSLITEDRALEYCKNIKIFFRND